LQRDDRRGDEGDALFFFNFLRKQRTKRKQERAFQKRVMMVEREKFGE
jgi:hypothetical protein